jgi:hypothetical protein
MFFVSSLLPLVAQEDPGQAAVAKLNVRVYFASDSDITVAGGTAKTVEPAIRKRLESEERLRFKDYRLMGEDAQPLLRSYESWAQPLKPSDEILLRFEAQGHPGAMGVSIDLELWQGRQKIMKSDALLKPGVPLYILGPEWRGGRLIVSVVLAPMGKTRS